MCEPAHVDVFDEVGRIAPGFSADIAVYRLDDPRYFGLHDPAIGPVASGGRPTLAALFSSGRQIVTEDVTISSRSTLTRCAYQTSSPSQYRRCHVHSSLIGFAPTRHDAPSAQP